jgi:hypothetical protein
LQRGSTPPLTCANTALARCSANPGTANETIVLDTVNQPSLVGGWTWTVRVFNNESAAVDYCIRVTTIEAPQVTVLQVNPPTARQTNSTGYADYYVVNIPPCPGSAEFQINQDLAAQVTVYLRTNHFPTDYDYFYRTNETAAPFIYLPLTSSSMPYPLTEGNWYIMVLHPDPITPTAYDIAVSFSAGSCDGPKLNVSAASYTASGFDLKWTALPSQSFQVQYTDVLPANWQNLGAPVTSSNGQFEFKDETAQSGLQRFYRLVELP